MKKIAVFVEGYTEQQFVIKLINSIAGKRGVTFELREQFKGLLQIVELRQVQDSEFFILLVNCQADSQVKSQVVSQHASLTASGYTKIIGLRDVFPHTHEDLPMVEKFLSAGLPVNGIKIEIVLAVMEVESWFIDELTHYSRIDPTMTVESIVAKGYDIVGVRGHQWQQPAATLDAIYSGWGIRYRKRTNQINRSVNALSDEELYVTVRHKAPSLDGLINSLEDCFFSNPPSPSIATVP